MLRPQLKLIKPPLPITNDTRQFIHSNTRLSNNTKLS